MALQSQLTAKVGRVFTKVSTRLTGSATTVKLLAASDTYGEFDEVLTVADSWFFEYSNFRKNFLLEIADTSDDLSTALGNDTEELTATHVRIDDDIYVIREGDTTPPKGTDVTWKIYCDLFERGARFESMR